ncbi:MAG: hypothetical protein R3F14_14570 [Polyangiaceae bacterium]
MQEEVALRGQRHVARVARELHHVRLGGARDLADRKLRRLEAVLLARLGLLADFEPRERVLRLRLILPSSPNVCVSSVVISIVISPRDLVRSDSSTSTVPPKPFTVPLMFSSGAFMSNIAVPDGSIVILTRVLDSAATDGASADADVAGGVGLAVSSPHPPRTLAKANSTGTIFRMDMS